MRTQFCEVMTHRLDSRALFSFNIRFSDNASFHSMYKLSYITLLSGHKTTIIGTSKA